MNITLTRHAHIRMKERLNIKSSKEMERMAFLAFNRGKPVGIEEGEFFGERSSKMIVQFNDSLFIYADSGALVTVIKPEHRSKASRNELLGALSRKEYRKEITIAA